MRRGEHELPPPPTYDMRSDLGDARRHYGEKFNFLERVEKFPKFNFSEREPQKNSHERETERQLP